MSEIRTPLRIEAAADDPRAWPAIEPDGHALYRRVRPEDPANGGVAWRLDGTEIVPGLAVATLAGRLPETVPDLSKQGWTCGMSPAGASDWREVRSEITRQTWLMFMRGDGAPAYAESLRDWQLEPGVWWRLRYYAPPRDHDGVVQYALAFYGAKSGTEQFTLWLLVQRPEGDEGWLGWFLTRGGNPKAGDHPYGNVWSRETNGYEATPGQDIALRIRVVQTHGADNVVVTGAGLGSAWTVPLPKGSIERACRAVVRVQGSRALYHLAQMEYPASGQLIEAHSSATGYQRPAHVAAGGATATAYGLQPVGTAAAASVTVDGDRSRLTAALRGTKSRSPVLYGVTEWRPPVFAAPVSDPVAVPGVKRVTWTLTDEGRGQKCEILFSDPQLARTAALTLPGVVTVQGGYQGAAPVTLFRGRVADPLRWRTEGGKRDDPRVTLVDDNVLLQKRFADLLSGSFAFLDFPTAAGYVLQAAGIEPSRHQLGDDTTPLVDEPDALRFSAQTSAQQALDTLAEARGWRWWFDAEGTVHAGERDAVGTDRGTLDDGNSDLVQKVIELTHDLEIGADYANAVGVLTGSGPGAYLVPDDTAPLHQELWRIEAGEYGNPALRARQMAEESRKRSRVVEWTMWVDFGALVLPRDTFTAGTLAGTQVPPGTTLVVRQAAYTLDVASGEAFVALVAEAEM